jgi:L-aspartate oxidase
VRELIEVGTKFDRTATGAIALTREGGHHRDRIAHAAGTRPVSRSSAR